MTFSSFGVDEAHNKRFKADSQRVAFLPCVDFSDLGGVQKHRIALLTT
ncbi:TPA: DUF3265 domain-containing protein [Vibrio parahaemolyticus]|nr:DUF3265 domain-containing protein [Vibrio parahaemolyticus]HCM0873388.1 DUF3265 domain-containing protein [Vibrio parahaemolyticus]